MRITPKELFEFASFTANAEARRARMAQLDDEPTQLRGQNELLRAEVNRRIRERDMAIKTIEAMRPVIVAAQAWMHTPPGNRPPYGLDPVELKLSEAVRTYEASK